jgi:hypothetical protein
LLVFGLVHTSYAQQIKWLRVAELQAFINEIGAEYECEGADCTNNLEWPAQYGVGSLAGQHTSRQKGLWIGCRDFDDPVEGKRKSIKVVASGPRDFPDRINQIFPVEFKLLGKFTHPSVIVDGQNASDLNDFDLLDAPPDNTMSADREILVRFNTSMGISVTKRVLSFTNSAHGNYFIYDYTFKNTGIYNEQGAVKQQDLKDVWFFYCYRYAFNGVTTSSRAGSTWGAFSTEWGSSTLNHDFGDYRSESGYSGMRGFYAYYGPNKDSPRPAKIEDWGCPNQNKDGWLGAAKYTGCATLYADMSTQNRVDDPTQPKNTWFLASDSDIMNANVSQYNETYMSQRYGAMSEGHPAQPHDVVIGEGYAQDYADSKRNGGGGTSQGQGYGPYNIAFGDSIHIVFAEAVSGISWEQCRTIGSNWLAWRNGTGTPNLVMPDGSATTDFNDYKRRWVETGRDSIMQSFQRAMVNFQNNYQIQSAPLPPSTFTVTSGGEKIHLEWMPSDDETRSDFNGYVVYRSQGRVLDYEAVYEKIFECNKSNIANSFDDITAKRGVEYYYYVQAKDDGSQNTVNPGTPLYSSMFWTVTSVGAVLGRPATPATPLPPDEDANWKQITDKGEWFSGTDYLAFDAVTYNNMNYVCIVDIAADTTAPDIDKTNWKRTIATGEWKLGSGYGSYSIVAYLNTNYVNQFTISPGKGLECVRVVPNPYDIRARLFQFGDISHYDQIAFYGLPAVCKLKIFTERGDLIWEKDHTNTRGDDYWNSQTSSGQIVVSGIYILYVEAPGQGSVCRKFVVIR